MTWTDARIETLTNLWGDGLSASLIAASLGGTTRNAVIGKVRRLGLRGRATLFFVAACPGHGPRRGQRKAVQSRASSGAAFPAKRPGPAGQQCRWNLAPLPRSR